MMVCVSRLALLLCFLSITFAAPGYGQTELHDQTAPNATPPPAAAASPAAPVLAKHGMVVSQEKRATAIGLAVLEQGGNAVDAAVAVGFALAVTLPKAGNIGGGGFMLVHLADRHRTIAIDYRETAPAATRSVVFLDDNGKADPRKSRDSGLGVGVPGTVAGLALAHARYGSGKFTLAQLMAPAIKLAREGFPVEDDLVDSLLLAEPRLARWPSSASIFLKTKDVPLGEGDRLVQPQLATTLEEIARHGPGRFYRGPIADKIVAAVRAAGGSMTRDDLRLYRPVVRTPLHGRYRGYGIAAMPPPSSGGVHLIEMLNILEGFPLGKLGAGTPQSEHLIIEAMKRAYADRAKFLGDSDHVIVPIARLISKSYAASARALIDPNRAQSAQEIDPNSPATGGGNTTHFSVVDRFGNAVANTYSLNFNYGLGLVADGTGVLLNNELDDFAAKPGAPNAFGLVGGAANAPGPGKRPLSSMCPTIVFKDGKPILVTGAPGGSRIITSVLQVILNVIDYDMNIAQAVAAPRVHHQWLPDEVVVEKGLSADTIRGLEARGDKVRIGPTFGSANSIAVSANAIAGAADTRARGAVAQGY
jgi:gamma-glutamyltranspeptidase / glutathione hydrolase